MIKPTARRLSLSILLTATAWMAVAAPIGCAHRTAPVATAVAPAPPATPFAATAAPAAAAATPVAATPAAARPTFEAADVHYSYHRYGSYVNGGYLVGDHYILRQATMLDLIGEAYGVDRDHILRGPLWMEADRFDLLAKAPAGTSKERVAQMLQTLLADRFKLAVHKDTKVMPAYVLSVGNGAPKLKQVDAADQSGCGIRSTSTGPVQVGPGLPAPEVVLFCNSVTMQAFAETLHSFFGGPLGAVVVDSTGLKGTWNLEMRMTLSPDLKGAAVMDAVKSQLGMKLESAKTAQKVMVVDSVERKPSPNPPEVARLLPPADLQFDVAVIHLAPPRTGQDKRTHVGINGHEAIFHNTSMQFLIMLSYDVNETKLVDIPPWFLSSHWDIRAKAPIDPASKNADVDMEDVKVMLRSLLADRFKLKMHTEVRPADGMVMVAAGPKLKKAADTDIRSTCSAGQPGPDGKDPRIANPILTGLITCRNVTMAEFADRLSTLLSEEFKTPVADGTGLTGRYDLQFSYTKDMRAATATPAVRPNAAAAADGPEEVSDPSGVISLMDAFSRQLGLKFEQKKRPMQVLVLDHIEETPTEN